MTDMENAVLGEYRKRDSHNNGPRILQELHDYPHRGCITGKVFKGDPEWEIDLNHALLWILGMRFVGCLWVFSDGLDRPPIQGRPGFRNHVQKDDNASTCVERWISGWSTDIVGIVIGSGCRITSRKAANSQDQWHPEKGGKTEGVHFRRNRGREGLISATPFIAPPKILLFLTFRKPLCRWPTTFQRLSAGPASWAVFHRSGRSERKREPHCYRTSPPHPAVSSPCTGDPGSPGRRS